MQPKISIIIPSYQHAPEIGACLESIFAQTYKEYEIIVVNDGSTDATEDAIAPYRDRIAYVYQANAGAPSARNRGFRDAQGEYLLFCDADIVMRPDCLQKMVQALEDHPEASYAYVSFRFGFKTFKLWEFDADLLRKMNYIHTTSLIRREHFPGFDESVKRLQDWDLWLTMLEQGHVGVWVPEVLFKAIPHKGGMSMWVPGIVYRIPWRKFGIRFRNVEKFREAEKVMKAKHKLD
ncbi:glycosyltransferase family 2 protein [Patescibacteria group bacterium]